jgi:hypothetical protein
MEPLALLTLLVCAWALLNFWLLPLSRDRWLAADLRQKIAKAGSLAVLEKARDYAAVGMITLGVVVAVVWAAHAAAVSRWLLPQALVATLASVYDSVKAVSEGYSSALEWIGLGGAAIVLYVTARQAQRSVSNAWTSRAREVYDKLVDDPAMLAAAGEDPALKLLVERVLALAAHAAGESESDENARRPICDEMHQLLAVLAMEIARKDINLDQVLSKATESEQASVSTRSRRLMRVLMSERLCRDLGLVKKPLSYATAALLFVSLVGWTAEPLANSFQLAVNNLRVNMLNAEAGQELDRAMSVISPKLAKAESMSTPLPQGAAAAVQNASRAIARAVTHELLRAPVLDGIAATRRSSSSEFEFVRAALAEHTLDADARAPEVGRVRREVAEEIAHARATAPEVARVEAYVQNIVRPDAERLYRDKPGLLAAVTQRLEARYGNPAAPLDAQGKIVAQMIDQVFGGLAGSPQSEAAKQAQKLAKELGSQAVKTWIDSIARSYVANALFESARGEVLEHVLAFRFDGSHGARAFAVALQEAQGSGWRGSAANRQEAEISGRLANKIADAVPNDRPNTDALRAEIRERLSGYDALFPRGHPIEDNAMAVMPQNLGSPGSSGAAGGPRGGGGGREPPRATRASTPSSGARAFAQARSMSFRVASTSFRVRGVLFGREQQGGDIDVRDIRWTVRAASTSQPVTRVALETRLARGWVELGMFDAAVINQALRYAADGRVVATTMMPGDGRAMRRLTFLHPVLVDTPLGCRVIEADRFVDTFSFPSRGSSPAAEVADLAADREQMAGWITVMKLAERVALRGAPRDKCIPPQVAARIDGTPRVRFSPRVSSVIEGFLVAEENRNAGSTHLLREAHRCATGEGGKLSACICAIEARAVSGRYWVPEDHTSQYREQESALTEDLAWMRRSSDHLGNIDLWVHTTLAMHEPSSDGPKPDETTAIAINFPREELDALRRVVREALPQYLAQTLRSPSYDDFMAPLEDFVLLQRFTRAALSGRLGRDFPMTKLVQLERATRSFVPRQPTVRWEPFQSAQSFATALSSVEPKASAMFQEWAADRDKRIMERAPVCGRVSK